MKSQGKSYLAFSIATLVFGLGAGCAGSNSAQPQTSTPVRTTGADIAPRTEEAISHALPTDPTPCLPGRRQLVPVVERAPSAAPMTDAEIAAVLEAAIDDDLTGGACRRPAGEERRGDEARAAHRGRRRERRGGAHGASSAAPAGLAGDPDQREPARAAARRS